MKLVRFGAVGKEKPGLIDADGVIRDLSGVISDFGGASLTTKGLARLRKLNLAKLPKVSSRVRLGSCVPQPGNFIAIGLNYADHAAETGAAIPAEPIIFNKAPSCISGPNDNVVIPRGSTKTDWEVELAIVIGDGQAGLNASVRLGDMPVLMGRLTPRADVAARLSGQSVIVRPARIDQSARSTELHPPCHDRTT